jgi:hypothetical protein
MMELEFNAQDFSNFTANPETMCRYQECSQRCLLFNFGGAIAPLIQEVVEDSSVHNGALVTHGCEVCPLDKREYKIAILLLIDALL